MAKQSISAQKDFYQNQILDLEKKYFSIIEGIITSMDFLDDLLLIEKETVENYPKYATVWNIKDKIKVPVERLIRQHIYLKLASDIKGIYPSPISSDLGIRMNDAVLCIDAKTIDTHGNAGDLRSTGVEKNQNSFDNRNFPFIKTDSNLESIDHYSRLPVLTYIIKVVYYDDNYSFKLGRSPYPSMALVCIPNGKLSSLFDYNIIDNFKTYSYYDENEALYYKPILIPNLEASVLEEWLKINIEERKGFQKVRTDYFSSKHIYYDVQRRVLWWETTISKKHCIAAVKSGNTVRYNNECMRDRYDSDNNYWVGYREYQIPDPLPSAYNLIEH